MLVLVIDHIMGAFGIHIVSIAEWRHHLPKFKCIFNTNYLSASCSITKGSFYHCIMNFCVGHFSSSLLMGQFWTNTGRLWPI